MAETRENRVTEVMDAVQAYGAMASSLSRGNPLVAMAMAQWISILMQKLVDWGALTEEEHGVLLGQMVAEIAERRKQEAREAEDELRVNGDVQSLLDHIGI